MTAYYRLRTVLQGLLLGAVILVCNTGFAQQRIGTWQSVSEDQPGTATPVSESAPVPSAIDVSDWQEVTPGGSGPLLLDVDSDTATFAEPSIQEIEQGARDTLQNQRQWESRQLAQQQSTVSGSGEYLPELVTRNIDMFVGELQVLGKVQVSRVAVGNGGIIRAELLKTGELLVIAQKAGSTSLRLWHDDDTQSAYNIRISEFDPETRVRMERMVRLRVRMVEFRKSALGELGIDWADSANGPGYGVAGDFLSNNLFRPATEGFENLPNQVAPFSTYFGIATNVTSRINFLAQNGDAVTLAEPVLSAVNGGTASFLAGGEVPFPTVGSNGQTTVDFKEYGVRLNIAPRIDSGGNVRTSVEAEISELDEAVTVNGAPGLLTRRAQTEVNVRSGETIVISGLLSSNTSKALNAIPGLGRLPVIGKLFGSEESRETVGELVIFVTPEVIEPDGLLTSRQQEIQRRSEKHLDTAQRRLQLME